MRIRFKVFGSDSKPGPSKPSILSGSGIGIKLVGRNKHGLADGLATTGHRTGQTHIQIIFTASR